MQSLQVADFWFRNSSRYFQTWRIRQQKAAISAHLLTVFWILSYRRAMKRPSSRPSIMPPRSCSLCCSVELQWLCISCWRFSSSRCYGPCCVERFCIHSSTHSQGTEIWYWIWNLKFDINNNIEWTHFTIIPAHFLQKHLPGIAQANYFNFMEPCRLYSLFRKFVSASADCTVTCQSISFK